MRCPSTFVCEVANCCWQHQPCQLWFFTENTWRSWPKNRARSGELCTRHRLGPGASTFASVLDDPVKARQRLNMGKMKKNARFWTLLFAGRALRTFEMLWEAVKQQQGRMRWTCATSSMWQPKPGPSATPSTADICLAALLGIWFFLVGALSFHYFKAQHHTPPYQRHQGNNLWKLKCGRVLVNSNWLWVRRWDVVQGSTFNGYNHQSYSWGLHPILWRKIASNSNRFSRKHPNPIRYI